MSFVEEYRTYRNHSQKKKKKEKEKNRGHFFRILEPLSADGRM